MKKGFTLIELMVVIVIIGILAAIAVPKMFGMSAKAKASEVGPAAGSWSKITAAYITEVGTAGSWISVSYIPPGAASATYGSATSNFYYGDVAVATNLTNGTTNTTASGVGHAYWGAANITKLNNCAAGKKWAADYDTSNVAKPIVGGGALTDAACNTLTPNFSKLQ